MHLRHIIGILLILQLATFTHLLHTINTGPPTSHITATGGTVTQVNTAPTTNWGGTHGTLTGNKNTITITPNTIQQNNLAYNDTDNECKKTELFASTNPTNPETITTINTTTADNILGYNPTSTTSITHMFTQTNIYDIEGTLYTLPSTTTYGKLTNYTQGIAQNNGSIVFITKTVRNGRAYNNEPADYQLILPPGTWSITYDTTDSCTLLDNYSTTPTTNGTLTIDAALPNRICTEQQNTLYAITRQDRTHCRPNEVGEWWCTPLEDADIKITHEGNQVHKSTTPNNGSITFTPTQNGEHRITITKNDQTTTRIFNTEECLDYGTITDENTIIQLGGTTITPYDFGTPPETQTPGEILETLRLDLLIITLLASLIILLGTIGLYQKNKDTNELLLKLRIWLLEHK